MIDIKLLEKHIGVESLEKKDEYNHIISMISDDEFKSFVNLLNSYGLSIKKLSDLKFILLGEKIAKVALEAAKNSKVMEQTIKDSTGDLKNIFTNEYNKKELLDEKKEVETLETTSYNNNMDTTREYTEKELLIFQNLDNKIAIVLSYFRNDLDKKLFEDEIYKLIKLNCPEKEIFNRTIKNVLSANRYTNDEIEGYTQSIEAELFPYQKKLADILEHVNLGENSYSEIESAIINMNLIDLPPFERIYNAVEYVLNSHNIPKEDINSYLQLIAEYNAQITNNAKEIRG